MLPLGGLAMAVFASWFMGRDSTVDELQLGEGLLYRAWRFAARYLAPLGVLLIFMSGLGVI